ncbi:MAG: nitroreductase family protein [Bacteroidota bacterium]|nr:nitroreductase family protein [Bacteroidota bacterium]
MQEATFVSYHANVFTAEEALARSTTFYEFMDSRRTVRDFSSKPIADRLLENIIKTAGTAPSGAHKQPWTFCLITHSELKTKIRQAAEKEEYDNYHGRMNQEWMDDLSILGTDWKKPFLEIAPVLIIVFRKTHDIVDSKKRKNYYVQESVGLACGLLIAAIHQAGLVCLTHTPSPMNFLQEILRRPENEKPFLLIPVGYPAEHTTVPDIHRKDLSDILVRY